MKNNLFFLIAGLSLGLLAAFLFNMVDNSGGVVEISQYSELNEIKLAIERLSDKYDGFQEDQKRSYDGLSSNVDELRLDIESLNEAISAMVPTVAEESNSVKEKILPSLDTAPEWENAKKSEGDWVSLIDKGLARILVENGMTPFHYGVSPLLKKAATEIREVEKRLHNKQRELLRLYSDVFKSSAHPDYKARQGEMFAVEAGFKREREMIRETFEISLCTLVKAKNEK